MATTKVGIYRSFYGPVLTDSSGQPLRESEWLKKRPFSWVVRWYGADGNRYSKSVNTRKEAERYSQKKQTESREGKADPPQQVTLGVILYTTGLRLREALNLTWSDIDFANSELHVTRRSSSGFVQAWTPKDHQLRTIPLSEQAISHLAAWQAIAPEQCPYVFMDEGRWQYYRSEAEANRWTAGRDLVNNVLRRF